MKPNFVVATAGSFSGQVGRVITAHTYPEIGLHYSVRFPGGSVWIRAADVRLATVAEAPGLRPPPRTLRPAA